MAQPGARSATGGRNYGIGWLPWLALFLIALIVAVTIFIIANVS
jgi:hypothetical protein